MLKTSCVRQKICFERATAFTLPLLLKKGGEGRGEEALLISFPSLRLSPRSCLAGRERQNAASALRAEHNCSQSRAPQDRRCPRRFGQILIDCKSALRARLARQADTLHLAGRTPAARTGWLRVPYAFNVT